MGFALVALPGWSLGQQSPRHAEGKDVGNTFPSGKVLKKHLPASCLKNLPANTDWKTCMVAIRPKGR